MVKPSRAVESVGARIRQARRAQGWTQDDLAAAVGVSRSAVAQWETDRAGQIRDNLGRIAQALGVNVAALLDGAVYIEDQTASSGDERALLRLYRACDPEDRSFLLRTARKLAATQT
jgi:transcriptional regulator with XRE-family HTH domain